MEQLQTVDQVIEKLGGTVEASRLAGVYPSQISTWRSTGKLGAKTYLILQDALKSRGYTAPASLWGMIEPAQSEQERAA